MRILPGSRSRPPLGKDRDWVCSDGGLVWSKRSHAQAQNIKPCAFEPPAWLFSQDLLHRFPVGEFVDQFVQVADFLHRRFLDVFHANATDRTGN